MCRGSTTACSTNTVGSPNAPSASRMQVSTASRSCSGASTRRMPRPPPPATALTKSGYGSALAASTITSASSLGGTEARVGTPASLAAAIARALLPVRREHVGGRPDEGDAGVGAGLGEPGVLGEEAVARVDRVGPGADRDRDDRVRVEVRADGVPALTDLVRLVGLQAVLGPAVLVGEHRDRAGPELVGGAERPDGDLAPVGHEHLGEHGPQATDGGSRRCFLVRPMVS